MESKLVTEFIQQTNCEENTAYAFLQAKRWDLNLAVEAWQRLNDIATPSPTSPVAPPTFANSLLTKSASIDIHDNKKLIRGISRATDNLSIVSRARNAIAQDFEENPCFKIDRYFIETPEYTFTLPDLTIYGDEFKSFLEKDLIEKSALNSLEQSGRLNWWSEYGFCQRLWPLSTSGDGNCLLHAASLGMWGFHDRLLTLRRALYAFLKESECQNALYRRWRWQQTRTNAQSGFVYSEAEWQTEWETIINMASTEPRREKNGRRMSTSISEHETHSSGTTYESLEEIHVLALAHILKRPIIIIADTMLKDMNGEAIAPIPFGGIYLPFEIPLHECHRSPLLLTYDMAHFSALVVMEKEVYGEKHPPTQATIPLVDSENCLLQIQFSVDPGIDFNWGQDENEQNIINSLILSEKAQLNLLKEYLDIVEIPTVSTPSEDDPFDSEEEIDKKFSEVSDLSEDVTDGNLFGNNKSRAAKQLQSVAKQFGSIGKSMSRKLKKNFGKITKPTTQKKSHDVVDNGSIMGKGVKLLCAQLHVKRHEYQEEMVTNYLKFAQGRFLKELQGKSAAKSPEIKLEEQAIIEGPMQCINPGCNDLGTAVTSYMCHKCFEQQRKEELSHSKTSPTFSQARYGTGKSKFYRHSDAESHINVKRLPTSKPNTVDHTLYLSKSTFYNDTGAPLSEIHHNGRSTRPKSFDIPHVSKRDYIGRANRKISDLRPTSELVDIAESKTSELLELNSGHSSNSNDLVSLFNSHNSLAPHQSELNQFSAGPKNHPEVVQVPQMVPNSETFYTLNAVVSSKQCNENDDDQNCQQCRANNCNFFGNASTDFYCSQCFKRQQRTNTYGTLI